MTVTSRSIFVTFRISANTIATDSILHSVDVAIFEVKELENKEGNDVSLARDLESNCDITIFVTCCIFSNTNDIDLGVDFTIFEVGDVENEEIIYI